MANLSEKKLSTVCVKCAQNTMRLNKKNGENTGRRGCDWHKWISLRKMDYLQPFIMLIK